MNKIWIEYLNRFARTPKLSKPKMTKAFKKLEVGIKNDVLGEIENQLQNKLPVKFFTQLSLDEYFFKLPYIFNIEVFCLRLYKAKVDNHKICIYSDYDTDAVTATATMYWGLIELGFDPANLSFYAPDRFTEGYGMNVEAVADLALQNDLVISVDCGINSVAEAVGIQNLKKNKLSKCDLIITDHHHLVNSIPDCTAVLNPRLAEYYRQNSMEVEPSKKIIRSLFDSIEEETLQKFEAWVEKVYRSSEKVISNPDDYLSESVTGVGVAWFCLVWLGYFLEEIEVNI